MTANQVDQMEPTPETTQPENATLPAQVPATPIAEESAAPRTQPLTAGRIVHYRLSERDAQEINRRRVGNIGAGWPQGAQAHMGNEAKAGDVYPLIVVRAWSDTCLNGQVVLDGTDTFWALSRSLGDGDGHWSWPPRA